MTASVADCYGLSAMMRDDQRAQRGAHSGGLLSSRPQPAGMEQGMTALSYLISGVLVWGGLGWLADHLLRIGFLLPIGIVVGVGLGCYMIIARFGGLPARPTSSASPRGDRPESAEDATK